MSKRITAVKFKAEEYLKGKYGKKADGNAEIPFVETTGDQDE